MAGPGNVRSLGYFAAQMFDAKDQEGADYTVKGRAQFLLGAGRYAKELVKGIPIWKLVAGTFGPISGLFPWPAKTPRTLAQLSFCFPAKITAVNGSTYYATPIQTATDTGWTSVDLGDKDLDQLQVYTKDGAAPAVGDFGLVVIGTEMGAQKPLFFQGGGAGSTVYKVITNNTTSYVLHEYDFPGGTAKAGADVTGAKELNGSVSVPVNLYVEGTMRADGHVWFSMPYGC